MWYHISAARLAEEVNLMKRGESDADRLGGLLCNLHNGFIRKEYI